MSSSSNAEAISEGKKDRFNQVMMLNNNNNISQNIYQSSSAERDNILKFMEDQKRKISKS